MLRYWDLNSPRILMFLGDYYWDSKVTRILRYWDSNFPRISTFLGNHYWELRFLGG